MQDRKEIRGVIVQICGDEYQFASEGGDAAEVQQVAAYVDQKMQEIASKHDGRVPKAKLAVWAAMEITADLFRAMQERNMLTEKAHENIERLTKLVEERAQMSSVFAARKSSPLERQFLEQPTVQQD